MRASNNRLLTGQDLRASDAERDEAIGELRDRFAEGRLSHETFLYRMDAALRAKDRSELSDLFADWIAAGDQLKTPQAAMSGALPGQADAGFFAVREPQSLCLPRQADRRFTIGRAPSCDFTVADLSVSRCHARLHHEDGNWLLSDLGSTNGTRLNGWRVTSAVPVQPGDNVSFGSAAYVIIDRPVAAGRPSGTD